MIDTTPPSTVILVPVQQFSQNNPPPYSPVPGIPPQLQAAVPVIAAVTANKVGNNAATSPIFCFLYNRITMNAMRNKEWQKLLEAVTYHTWYNINTRKFQTEEQALDQASRDVIMVYASYIAVNTPEMRNLLTISQQNEVIEYAKRWEVFVQEYQRLEQEARTVATNVQSSFAGGFQPTPSVASGWATPNSHQAATGAGGLGSFAPAATYVAPGQDITQKPVRDASFYDEPVTTPYRPAQKEMFIPGVNQENTRQTEQPKKPPKASFLNYVTEIHKNSVQHLDRTATPIESVSADKWEPSPFQPYHPAYRYNQEATYEYQLDASGIRRVIAIVSPKETEMDKSKHNFASPASMFSNLSFGHAYAEITVAEALTATAKAILSGEVGENKEATDLYKSLGVIDSEPVDIVPQTSLTALIAEARAYWLASGSTEPTFLVGSSLSCQVVSKTSHLDIVKQLRHCTLEAAAKYLRGMVEEIKFTMNPEDAGKLQFILGIDRAIKRELLNLIRFRMGVGPDFNFDSFFEDEEGIRAALQSVHGIAHANSYKTIQSQLLPTLFDESLVSEVSINKNETDAEPAGFITSFSPMVTMLLMNLSDEQLGFMLPDGAVCEVFADTFPGLYAFIGGVVKSNPGSLHHYIVTNDDVVYEVNVGLVGANHMVLTRVNVGV